MCPTHSGSLLIKEKSDFSKVMEDKSNMSLNELLKKHVGWTHGAVHLTSGSPNKKEIGFAFLSCGCLGSQHKHDNHMRPGLLGAVWLYFFDHSISITHHSSLITHNSSLNFSHPFGIITQFPSLNIFHTICGPIPVSRYSFFFFFSVPNLPKLI